MGYVMMDGVCVCVCAHLAEITKLLYVPSNH
jgi:hypothetical protein